MRKTITILLALITLLAVSCDMMFDDTNHNPWIHVREEDTGEEYDVQSPYYEIQYDVEYHIGDVGPCGGIIIYDVDADNVYEERRECGATWVDALPGSDYLVSGICGYRYVEAMPYDMTTVDSRVAYVLNDNTTGVLKVIADVNEANTLGADNWRLPTEKEIYSMFDLAWEGYYNNDLDFWNTFSQMAGIGMNTKPSDDGRCHPYVNGAEWQKCHYWVYDSWAEQIGTPKGRPFVDIHFGCISTTLECEHNLRLVRSF